MVKILEDKYPMGSVKHQKSAGRYIDGYLYDNLKLLAEKIVDDMTFLAVGFSSTLEVGTGKSVLFTQIGEAWSYLMKKIHNIDVPFTQKNIVWRPKDLIERSFKVPRYSCILVDEWEDAHYWSELGMTLRQFFRKCRQLNLFILIIIPNFFQFPMNYALGRSIFCIDVKFEGRFERGYFNFYDFNAKRNLYILGKKTQNYHVVKPTFFGRFSDGYGIPEEEYRKAKAEDLKNIDADEDKSLSPRRLEFVTRADTIWKIYQKRKIVKQLGDLPTSLLAEAFGVAERTLKEWLTKAKRLRMGDIDPNLIDENDENDSDDDDAHDNDENKKDEEEK